jgi:hypothetical protein
LGVITDNALSHGVVPRKKTFGMTFALTWAAENRTSIVSCAESDLPVPESGAVIVADLMPLGRGLNRLVAWKREPQRGVDDCRRAVVCY